MKNNILFLSNLAHFYLEWEVLRAEVVEIINTRIFCSVTFFSFENRAVYEIMWKSIVEPDRPVMTIWRMRIACWIPKATNTHSEYALVIAFPLQQWLHERDSILRYKYIACLVWIKSGQHGPNWVLHLLLKGKRTPLQCDARRSGSKAIESGCVGCATVLHLQLLQTIMNWL